MAFSAAASGPDPRASGTLPRDPSPPGTILTGFPGDALEWASVLDGRCPECGFDASQLPRTRLGEWIRAVRAYVESSRAHAEADLGGVSRSDSGWFAGIGLDYALNDRWTIGGEGLPGVHRRHMTVRLRAGQTDRTPRAGPGGARPAPRWAARSPDSPER